MIEPGKVQAVSTCKDCGDDFIYWKNPQRQERKYCDACRSRKEVKSHMYRVVRKPFAAPFSPNAFTVLAKRELRLRELRESHARVQQERHKAGVSHVR